VGRLSPVRRNRAEAVKLFSHPPEERHIRGRVACDIAEGSDGLDGGIPVRGLEREVAHPPTVGGDHAVDTDREDEPADRGRGEERAAASAAPSSPAPPIRSPIVEGRV